MSHGTLECYDMVRTRRFYEEFLGLECVRHGKPAMAVRLGMRFHIVCVEVGEQLKPVNMLNHWGVDVATREEVDRAHADALRLKDEYGIRQVGKPQDMHGVYSFYLVDLDHNWWEVQHYANGFLHDDYFDFGDRFAMADGRNFEREDELAIRVETA
ncbi:VOC family protein [Ramlibacter sp. AW1]|uniref:VOC family protein n=1 Tax=Ramlibacter aurantiacus TaxID=2801330 RepID=A0A936ZUV6_9BURK|nr:VOC family protein [Ramlibacter aurantiacus]